MLSCQATLISPRLRLSKRGISSSRCSSTNSATVHSGLRSGLTAREATTNAVDRESAPNAEQPWYLEAAKDVLSHSFGQKPAVSPEPLREDPVPETGGLPEFTLLQRFALGHWYETAKR